jgi:tetratricopeptide (TPR) repeat protein
MTQVRFAAEHAPFITALAAMADSDAEQTLRWQAVAAGLAVLHGIDVWADEPVRSTYAWRNIAERVDRLPETAPSRELLRAVAQSALSSGPRAAPSPLVPLMAYGRALESDAEWSLAADVYRTIADHAATVDASDLIPNACQRLAYCCRVLGQLDAADRAIMAGRIAAREQHDVVADLWLRLSAANLTAHRGNLPAAASALAGIVADARTPDARPVLIAAWHDSGQVAIARGQYERAALLFFAAAEAYPEALPRARALSDLATAASALGHWELARTVNEYLLAASPGREFRWTAAINLLELAVFEGRETTFEYYRQRLQHEPLPVALLASYHLYTGRGYVRFGRRLLARQALGRALGVATAASLNQLRHLADTELTALEREQRLEETGHEAPRQKEWSPAVDALVEGVDRLRAAMAD